MRNHKITKKWSGLKSFHMILKYQTNIFGHNKFKRACPLNQNRMGIHMRIPFIN
jgi:hypothetical protein